MNNRSNTDSPEIVSTQLMQELSTLALRSTRHPQDAEDLVQDAYLKAIRFYNRFESGTNLHGWMVRILQNLSISRYHRKKRLPAEIEFDITSLTMVGNDHLSEAKDLILDNPESYQDVFDDRVTTALDRLPEKYRTPILLRDVAEMSYLEVSRKLDWPLGTVMSRISRGRQILARSLRSYAEKHGFIGAG